VKAEKSTAGLPVVRGNVLRSTRLRQKPPVDCVDDGLQGLEPRGSQVDIQLPDVLFEMLDVHIQAASTDHLDGVEMSLRDLTTSQESQAVVRCNGRVLRRASSFFIELPLQGFDFLPEPMPLLDPSALALLRLPAFPLEVGDPPREALHDVVEGRPDGRVHHIEDDLYGHLRIIQSPLLLQGLAKSIFEDLVRLIHCFVHEPFHFL